MNEGQAMQAFMQSLMIEPEVMTERDPAAAARFIVYAMRGFSMRQHIDRHHPGEVNEGLKAAPVEEPERGAWLYGYLFADQKKQAPSNAESAAVIAMSAYWRGRAEAAEAIIQVAKQRIAADEWASIAAEGISRLKPPTGHVTDRLTDAERRALNALHRWLHSPCGDDGLIEEAQDYHEQLIAECAEDCDCIEKDARDEWAMQQRGGEYFGSNPVRSGPQREGER